MGFLALEHLGIFVIRHSLTASWALEIFLRGCQLPGLISVSCSHSSQCGVGTPGGVGGAERPRGARGRGGAAPARPVLGSPGAALRGSRGGWVSICSALVPPAAPSLARGPARPCSCSTRNSGPASSMWFSFRKCQGRAPDMELQKTNSQLKIWQNRSPGWDGTTGLEPGAVSPASLLSPTPVLSLPAEGTSQESGDRGPGCSTLRHAWWSSLETPEEQQPLPPAPVDALTVLLG